MRLAKNSGFTLIELVIIIVVLGILAAIAIPKYQDITSDAREAACRGALGGLRSAITIYYANQAVKTGSATWPALDSLGTIGIVMEQQIPKNPYCPDANYSDSIVAGVSRGTIVGIDCGWAYNTATGEIWPNTNTAGENQW
ncbi:MAG: prepilin-type N-terminal cleavage/methylation domain-containing protein [candidate division Zixibacteria bacterium]